MGEIYNYYKSRGIKTEIMAASLRSIDECVHLAGVDLMTINVALLEELNAAEYHVKARFPHPNGKCASSQTSNVGNN